MSYILDALRRADAERARGAVPGLHASNIDIDDEPAARNFRPLIWAAGAVGVVLVAAVVLLVFAPWRDAAVPLAREPLAPAPELNPAVCDNAPATLAQGELPPPRPGELDPAARPVEPPLARMNADGRGDPTRPPANPAQPYPPATAGPPYPPPPSARADDSAATPRPGQPPRQPAAQTAAARASLAPSAASPYATATANAAAAAAPVEHYGPPIAAAPARPAAVVNINDLAPALRAQLPHLVVGGAIYSEQSSARMVILNGQVYHEGDKPAAETVIEQIRLKSAVLNWRGQRYELAF